MHVAAATHFACPIDGTPLQAAANALKCGQGHNFDRAREGYCNLLLVQHKASRDPGDSRDMVAARRRILDAGLYATIADCMFAIVRTLARQAGAPETGAGATLRIVDAGCGEGYYLRRLRQAAIACADPVRLELAGIDISKWAVQAAAKREASVAWAVASNRRLPFPPGSVDLILSMFGFPIWEGFKHVQPAGGHVLLVDPGADHLIELRSVIYPAVERTGPPSLHAAEAAGYRLEREQRLHEVVNLDQAAQIRDLLTMTPHAHRLPATGREAVTQIKRLSVTLDVVFRLLRLDA